jgi:hypothetical protein
MDVMELRNTLMSLEWSRRLCFAGTLIMVIGFLWLTIFLFQRFHIGLFFLLCLCIAEFVVIALLIPVIYLPYSKEFKRIIVSDFIKSKPTYLSLYQNEVIDRVDIMASQFFLKTPNDVWCEMVLKGTLKNYTIRCAMVFINSSEKSRQGGHYENMFFTGLFIIATPTTFSGKINCIDPVVLIVPKNEPYVQDINSLTMAIEEDSSYLTYNATKPITNGSAHSIYASKIPEQSLCIPQKQIRIIRKKSEQVNYEDSVFNDIFTVYCKDKDFQNKLKDIKLRQLLLKAKEKNGKGFYFSKFDNVVFAAFEREKDDFKPPLFVPINEKVIKKLDVSFQKTLEEINQTIEIAEYLK